jgi:hypothetical protein
MTMPPLLLGTLLAVSAIGAEPPAPLPTPSPAVKSGPKGVVPAPTSGEAQKAAPAAATNSLPALVPHELPDIQGAISIPKEWTLITGKLLEGDVLVACREKISGADDPWTTGLTMTIDRNGAKDSGQPAGEYALGMAKEAREKAGDEAGEIKETRNGKIREFRFEYPVALDAPIQVTEVLRADEESGMLTVILWQSPKEEASSLKELREAVLSSIRP